MSKRVLYVLYDERACGGKGTDDAIVLCSAESPAEARCDAKIQGFQSACYSYAAGDRDWAGKLTLIDERWEWDWSPSQGFTVAEEASDD